MWKWAFSPIYWCMSIFNMMLGKVFLYHCNRNYPCSDFIIYSFDSWAGTHYHINFIPLKPCTFFMTLTGFISGKPWLVFSLITLLLIIHRQYSITYKEWPTLVMSLLGVVGTPRNSVTLIIILFLYVLEEYFIFLISKIQECIRLGTWYICNFRKPFSLSIGSAF